MTRRMLAVLGCSAFALIIAVAAEPVVPPATPPAKGVEATPDNIVRTTVDMAREYKKFEDSLLRIAQRMERSSRPEERERADALRKAIDLANKTNVENRFNTLVTTLVGNKNLTTDELKKAGGQNEELIKILRDMLELLLTDSELLKKKAEIAKLSELIKQIGEQIKAEKIIQTKADSNRVASHTIAKEQNNTTKATESIARQMGAKPNDGKKGNEAKAKSGDPKKAGEPKDDTKEQKATDKKSDDKKSGDAKAGDPKSGEPKAGDPKSGDPKAGSPKSGDQKPMDPMKSPSEQKNGKPGEQKNKPDNKADAKSGPSQSGKPMDGDSKNGKPSQSKPSQSQQQQQQSSKSKPNQGQDQQSQQQQQQQQDQQSPEQTKAQKKIQDAIQGQKKTEEDLKKDERDPASRKIDKVLEDLQIAKEELEKRLRQLREEELERLLANLQSRCERMLAMQMGVRDGTKGVWGVILTYENKKPTRAEEQRSQQLSTAEGDIVKLANSTLQLLGAEGSAVAFAMSLENVRDDMSMIERRLDKYDAGTMTQQMEEDVIAALKEMIEALKKAIQEQKDKKNNPPKPNNSPPPPQKLLDLLAELKLIRSQQMQVNKRTTQYGKQDPVEQTDNALIQKELEIISKRQVRLEDMLKKIATGKNQ